MKTHLAFTRAFFVTGALLLTAGHSVDTWATDASCVLYTNDAAHENVAGWRAAGFTVTEIKDLETLPITRRAVLFDDTHFGLIRGATDFMWMGLTHGRYVKGWDPARFAAPARGAAPDARYACGVLHARLPFYVESRRAASDVMGLVLGRKLNRTIGEAILDLERSYLVNKGWARFEKTNAKAAYLKLLAQAREFDPENYPDFFSYWLQIRKLVYGKDQAGIKYCDEKASMTLALTDHCVNCVGETYLLTALFLDLGLTPPAGYRLGTQLFIDHIRPVLYNLQKGRTYDMVGGGVGPFRSAIMKPGVLASELWLGDKSLRAADEFDAVKAVKVDYVYRDWKCIFTYHVAGRNATQASDLTHLDTCQMFADGDEANPHRANNQSKTKDVTYDETKKRKKNTNGEDNEGDGGESAKETKSDKDGKSGADSADQNDDGGEKDSAGENNAGGSGEKGPKGTGKVTGHTIFESIKAFGSGFAFFGNINLRDDLPEYYLKIMNEVAGNLNPLERKTFEIAIAQKIYTQEFVDIGSQAILVREMGFGQLLHRGKNDRTIMPLVIVRDLSPTAQPATGESGFRFSTAQPNDTVINTNVSYEVLVTTSNAALQRLMKSAPLAMRFRMLISLLAKDAVAPTEILRASSVPSADLIASLDGIENQPALRDAMVKLQQNIGNLQSVIGQSSAYTRYGDEKIPPLKTAIVQTYLNESGMDRIIGKMVRSVDVMTADPAAMVRWIASKPGRADLILNEHGFAVALGDTVANLRQLLDKDHRFSRWNNYATGANLVTDKLLFGLLSHRDFFFTVKPERDEKVAERPFYPLDIRDPRVAELMKRSESRVAAHVNLPTLPGLTCPPGQKGFFGAGVVIECGRGTDAAEGNDDFGARQQAGVLNGDPRVTTAGLRAGSQDQAQKGFIAESTQGRDAEAGRVTNIALTPDQQRVAATRTATRIQTEGRANSDQDLLADPRQEVDLPVELWQALLDSADTQLNTEPLVEILMHHAYRRRMAPVFDRKEVIAYHRLIDFSTYENPEFIMTGQHWDDLQMDGRDSRFSPPGEEAIEDFARVDAKTFDRFEGLSNEAFFKVAMRELRQHKDGFIYINRGEIARSGSITADFYAQGPAARTIRIAPARVSTDAQVLATFDGYTNKGIIKRIFDDDHIPPLTFQFRFTSVADPGMNVIGIARRSGGYLGHAYVTYSRYDTRVGASADELIHQARLDLVKQPTMFETRK